jgi:hypothetical protein
VASDSFAAQGVAACIAKVARSRTACIAAQYGRSMMALPAAGFVRRGQHRPTGPCRPAQEFDMKQRSISLATLGLLAAMGAHAAVPTRLLGDVIPVTQASRTIRIDPATRYVNVYRGETIRFLANGQQFGYFFDGAPGEASFDLRRVAPQGMLEHRVLAYITPDPYNRWSP